MKNKIRKILILLLSILIFSLNISFIYAEDEILTSSNESEENTEIVEESDKEEEEKKEDYNESQKIEENKEEPQINTGTNTIIPTVETIPTEPEVIIPKPKIDTIIDTTEPPKANYKVISYWALINLIATIIGVIFTILLVFRKNKEEENEEEQEIVITKHNKRLKIVNIIIAIISIIIFILTEDMSLPMVLIDKWTIIMINLAIIEILIFFLAKKKKN